jgi:hypothetical protein
MENTIVIIEAIAIYFKAEVKRTQVISFLFDILR